MQEKTKKEKRKIVINALRGQIKKGDTIYTILTKVNNIGTYRHIKPILFKNNEPSFIGWRMSKALEYTYKEKTSSIGIGGGGMDMGFHLVYNLSSLLFNDGYVLKHRWL